MPLLCICYLPPLHCVAVALDSIALPCTALHGIIALHWMQCPTIALGVALHCRPIAEIIGVAGCTELQLLLAQP